VGITLTTLDDIVRAKMEPGASSVDERLRALSEHSKNGIKTWVFLGPVMPYITDVEALIWAIAEVKPEYVLVKPEVLSDYERIFLRGEDYYSGVFERVLRRCEEKGVRCEINRLRD
jgi:DNA repair photolyase